MANDKNQTKEKSKSGEKPAKRGRVKETFAELKKVTWPTFGQTMKQTGAVFVVTIFFLIILLAMDQLLGFAHRELVKGMGDISGAVTALFSAGGLKNLAFSAIGGFENFAASVSYLPLLF